MWIVYKHTTPSGKVYIGMTNQKPEYRWNHGRGYKNNKYFYNAIKKYGWDNIKHEILFSDLTKEEASETERRCINEYNSTDAKCGYNLTTGGENYEFTDEVKARMRKPKQLTAEQRRALSVRGKERYDKYLKGRVITPEERQKLSLAKRGIKQDPEVVKKRVASFRKTYIQRGGLTDEHRLKISKALKGRTYSEETLLRMKYAARPANNHRSRKVRQIKDGIIIKEYCSAREAMRQTGINYTSIVRVCNKVKLKHAGGYQWEYVEA